MSNEISVPITAFTNNGTPLKRVPYNLITLERKQGQKQVIEHFISFDKPLSENGFIQAKGIYCDQLEEEIIKNYGDIIATTPKENVVEMMFPYHRIVSVRSLIFNAVKGINQAK
jgi:hypothetical protein